MKKSLFKHGPFLLLLFNLISLLPAQEKVEISLIGGHLWGGKYEVSSGRIKIDSGPSFGFVVDIPVRERPGLMAELTYLQVKSTLSYQAQSFEPLTNLFDMTVHYFQAGGLYQENKGELTPFGAASIGAALFVPLEDQFVSEWIFSASLGFGAKYNISEHWGLRVQAQIFAPIQLESASLWCQSGSGCMITLKSGTVLLQGNVVAGLVYRF